MTLNFRGFPACACLIEWLPVYEAELIRRHVIRFALDIYQLIGGAPDSGGTHTKGGAEDDGQRDAVSIKVAREMGSAKWNRPFNWDNDGGMAHGHGVLNKCPHNGPARYQIAALAKGLNGLRNNGRDTGPAPRILRSFKSGIKWAANQIPITKSTRKWTVAKATTAARVYPGVGPVKAARKRGHKLTTTGLYKRHDGVLFARTRFGAFYDTRDLLSADVVVVPLRPAHFNLPAADKLANPEARAAVAVRLIAKAAPTFVNFNELEPIRNATKGSEFAGQIDRHLPGEWRWSKPSLPFNENYTAYRSDFLELLGTKDVVLPGATGGRHVTLSKFRHKATGFEFVNGCGHLVNGTTAAHEKDRQAQAKAALAAARDFAGGRPVILSFDANTTATLTALVDAGMKRTREYADTSTTRDDSTYTTYGKPRPGNEPKWIIDQQYVDPGFYVHDYTVVRELDTAGNYVQPRASDHDLIVSSLTTKK